MGGEKIVKILSPKDKAKIEAYCENAKTPIELRDAAILRIGKNIHKKDTTINKVIPEVMRR